MKKWINTHCIALTLMRIGSNVKCVIHIQSSVMKQSGLRIGDHVTVDLSACGQGLRLKRQGTINRPGRGYAITPDSTLRAADNRGRYIDGRVSLVFDEEALQGLRIASDFRFLCVDVLNAGHGELLAKLHSLFQPTEAALAVC